MRILFRWRFTITFLLVMLLANWLVMGLHAVLPNDALANWGVGYQSLGSGEFFRLLSGIFLSHDGGMLIRQLLFAAVIIGYTEWQRGSWVTALLFFSLDIIGTLLLLAFVGLGSGLLDVRALNDVGMSVGGFALIGVALHALPRANWVMLALLAAIVVKLLLAPDFLADGGHAIALVLGFGVGKFLPKMPLLRLKQQKK